MAEKKITPIIKSKRIIEETVETCPHCNKEIMEKSTFIDKTIIFIIGLVTKKDQ